VERYPQHASLKLLGRTTCGTEPKNIDSAGTVDAGKVLTPSASVAGEGVLRNLVESEIDNKTAYVTIRYDSVDTVADYYFPMEFAGTCTSIKSVIQSSFTGDTTLTCKVNDTAMTGGVLSLTAAGSAAGDKDDADPTANNTFAVNDYIRITSNLGATSGLDVSIMFTMVRD
jgi:hypothetical protein